MSLPCHEEIWRVGRVAGRGCYEDAGLRQVVIVEIGERHDTRTNGQHYTAADRRPADQSGIARGKLNGEVAQHARHPSSILASREVVALVGQVREDAMRML